MCRPIISFASVACVLVLATSGLVASHGSVHAADDCIAKPEGQGPQGSHWFYHTDETTNRKCWFLRADDGRILLGAQDATEDASNDTTDAADRPLALAPEPVTSAVMWDLPPIAEPAARPTRPATYRAAAATTSPTPSARTQPAAPAAQVATQVATQVTAQVAPQPAPAFAPTWQLRGGGPT